jgi:Flagellar assembly protein T, middle domain
MGSLIWPRCTLVLLFVVSLGFPVVSLAYQLIPDDIAYKPSAEKPTDDPNSPEANAETSGESIATVSNEPSATTEENNSEANTQPIAEKIATLPTTNCRVHSKWQKTLTIVAMPRVIPTQSSGGNFYQAETYIPRMLATELNQAIGVESRFIHQTISYQLDEEKKRRQVQTIALQQGTQFVLHGEILDMSMRDASTVYSPGFVQAVRNQVTDITMMTFSDNRDRLFSLRLELRDGFTGELLLEDSFQTTGVWKNPNPVGFTSEVLWKSQYGRRIKQLIHKAGNQIAENLQCQPYMAKIETTPGQNELLLQGGANNGLHPGDNLKLYQLVVMASPNHYDSYQTRLIKRDLQLELKEVYPSHSLAKLKGDDLLNGQYLAVGEE